MYTVMETGGRAGFGVLLRALRAAGLRESALCARYDGEDPGLSLCPTGILSSRRLAQKLEEDVAFRVLAAGNRPQHPTLFEFRWRHRADLGAVLVAVVQLARDLGLVSLVTLVPDSTKVRANAGKRKAMSIGRMQQGEARLNAEIEALQRQAEALDTADGCPIRDGPAGRRGARGPATAGRVAVPAVRPEPQSKYNFADPESRIMPTSQDGFQHCYNAQLVDGCGQPTDCGCGGLPRPATRASCRGCWRPCRKNMAIYPPGLGPLTDFRRGLNLHHPECRGFGC